MVDSKISGWEQGEVNRKDEDTAGGFHTSHLQERPLLQDRAPREGVCGRVEVDAH